jgi:hypothetical protein
MSFGSKQQKHPLDDKFHFKGKDNGGLPRRRGVENSRVPQENANMAFFQSSRLERRGEGGDTDEAEEGGVEGKTRSAVLVGAVAGVDVARVGGLARGVVVGLVVVAGAGERAGDTAVTALGAGSGLLQGLARLGDVAGRGDIEGTLDDVKRGEINPEDSMLAL